MRSASVDLPWSICAMIEKLRIFRGSTLWSVAAVELDALLDGIAATQAADALAAEPLAHERQVLPAERLEGDHAARRRSESSALSSRTPSARQASAYATTAPASATA